jgi:hypothetical protein
MKERPILFNTAMVQAILAGRKTQSRRLVPEWQLPSETDGPHDQFPMNRFISIAQRDQRYGFGVFGETAEQCMGNYNKVFKSLCPFGRIGDRLWVRESFRLFNSSNECSCSESPCGCPRNGTPIYRATHDNGESKWKPSIHMPRSACRIILEITNVRVERVIAISDSDAKAEGVEPSLVGADLNHIAHVAAFQDLWQSIYGNWDSHPWVWVIEFKVLTTNGVVPGVAA